jgi:hypothetical protein
MSVPSTLLWIEIMECYTQVISRSLALGFSFCGVSFLNRGSAVYSVPRPRAGSRSFVALPAGAGLL